MKDAMKSQHLFLINQAYHKEHCLHITPWIITTRTKKDSKVHIFFFLKNPNCIIHVFIYNENSFKYLHNHELTFNFYFIL